MIDIEVETVPIREHGLFVRPVRSGPNKVVVEYNPDPLMWPAFYWNGERYVPTLPSELVLDFEKDPT